MQVTWKTAKLTVVLLTVWVLAIAGALALWRYYGQRAALLSICQNMSPAPGAPGYCPAPQAVSGQLEIAASNASMAETALWVLAALGVMGVIVIIVMIVRDILSILSRKRAATVRRRWEHVLLPTWITCRTDDVVRLVVQIVTVLVACWLLSVTAGFIATNHWGFTSWLRTTGIMTPLRYGSQLVLVFIPIAISRFGYKVLLDSREVGTQWLIHKAQVAASSGDRSPRSEQEKFNSQFDDIMVHAGMSGAFKRLSSGSPDGDSPGVAPDSRPT